MLEQIREFNDKFHTYDPGAPTTEVDTNYRDLRIKLMQEELGELIEGMMNDDLKNIADGSADLLYVLMGTVSAYGLLDKFEAIFDEVHRSNMTKTYIEGQGKPAKLDGYSKPEIQSILEG